MPKIVINEVDLTQPVAAPYSSFAVVVPGPVAKDKGVDDLGVSIFDENDVYECKSTSDFESNIGLTTAREIQIKTEKSNIQGLSSVLWGGYTNKVGALYDANGQGKPEIFVLVPADNSIDSSYGSYTPTKYSASYTVSSNEEKYLGKHVLSIVDKGNMVYPEIKDTASKNTYNMKSTEYSTTIAGEDPTKKDTLVLSLSACDTVLESLDNLSFAVTVGAVESKSDTPEAGKTTFEYPVTLKVENIDGEIVTELTDKAEIVSEDATVPADNNVKDARQSVINALFEQAIAEIELETTSVDSLELKSNQIKRLFLDLRRIETKVSGSAHIYSLAKRTDGAFFIKNTGTDITPVFTEGSNAITTTAYQYGNQIAYYLLQLGYPVLYKRLSGEFSSLGEYSYWEDLTDKVNYDFRYIITGLLANNSAANAAILKLAEQRGDCVALLDIDETCYKTSTKFAQVISAIQAEANKYSAGGQFGALFAPTVNYNLVLSAAEELAFGKNTTFPAAFHFLACAARARQNFSEWYAIAGYTRGIANYSINSVGYNFGSRAIDALSPRNNAGEADVAVNLIANERGNYYIWGNRTAKVMEKDDLKASHFLNVRELCTSIKKLVFVTCRSLTFDPNSEILWIKFCNKISPLLDRMKGDQGIMDYRIQKVPTKQKGVLKAIVRIIPIEAVEDFTITLTLEDNLNGTVTVASEEV